MAANPFAEFAPVKEAENPFAEFAPKQTEVKNPFSEFAPKAKPEDQSAWRQVADVPLQLGQGAVAGVRMVADAFGANNPVSNALKNTEGYIGDLLSAQSKQDSQEVQRIMDEAKDKGVWDQVKAGLKAITVAPVDIVSNALGTSAGVIAASLLGGEEAATAKLIGGGMGVMMGAGNIKGTIYDAVKDQLQKTDMTPQEVEERAQLAQSYGGKNLDMILTGAALGGLGAATGYEPAMAKGIAAKIMGNAEAKAAAETTIEAAAKQELKDIATRGAVKQAAITGGQEFGTEFLEGGQQQLAENIALRREGYDVPIMQGVIAQGTLEGIAGLGLGTPTGYVEGRGARQKLAMLGEKQLTENEIKIVEAPLTQQERQTAGVDLNEDYVKQVATDLVSAGVSPESAREMAINIATEEAKSDAQFETEARGETAAAEPKPAAGGEGVPVAGQPDTGVAPAGVGNVEPTGVVPSGQDVAGVESGAGVQPTTLDAYEAAETERAKAAEELNVAKQKVEDAGYSATPELRNQLTVAEEKYNKADKDVKDAFAALSTETTEAAPTPEAKQATEAPAETPVQAAPTEVLKEQPAAQPTEQVAPDLKDKPTDVVAEHVEPLRLEPGSVTAEEETPAPAPKAETRGRKALTPEQKEASTQARKENTKLWKSINKGVDLALERFNNALTPLNPENYGNIQEFQEAVESQRIGKIQAVKSLLELQKVARGKPKLAQKINEALAHESITPKEVADIKAGMQRASKSTATKVGHADMSFNNFTNTQQALRHVMKTGNAFQKFLARRLLPFVKDVTFTVIEEGEHVPAVIRNGGAEADWDMSRGLFLRETASGQRHVFVRGMSGGPTQGINNVTVLHEALHAALNQKLYMGLDALQSGFDRNSDVARGMRELLNTMGLTHKRALELAERNELPEFMHDLTSAGIWDDPKEFLAYAMTDPRFQKFLMQTPGHVRESLFTRFVNSVREFFGMAPDTINALSDVVSITDKMLSSRLTPLMQANIKLEQTGAKGTAEVSAMAKKNVAKTDKNLDKLNKSNVGTIPQPGIMDAIRELVGNRDSKLMGDVLASNWDAWKSGSLRQLLPALQTETLVEWVESIAHKDKEVSGWAKRISEAWDMVKDMSAMRVQATSKAAPISNKLVDLAASNPQQYVALANVMHYSTLVKADPSKDTKHKALTELWNKLDDSSKKLFEEVRDYYASNYDLYHQLLMEQISKSGIPGSPTDPTSAKGKLMAEIKKMYETGAEEVTAKDGTKYRPPYFPLLRYGQYWMRVGKGKGREFYMFESQTDRNMFMRQRVRELQEAGDTRSYEDMYKDMDVQIGDNIQDARNDIKDTSALIKSIFGAIEDAAGKPLTVTDEFGNQVQKYSTIDPEKMKDEVYQLYLHTLPERNFRRQFIHRKGTTGFSNDISRNFATTATNMANQLARIKYSAPMLDKIQSAKDALAGNPEEARLNEFTTEMRHRIENEAYPDPGNPLGYKMSDIANKSAFLWMMSTVKTAVAQLSAIPVFAAPVLASKHGSVATAREMGRFLNIFNNMSVIHEAEDGTRTWTSPTVLQSKNVKLNSEERRAAQYMVDRGISETTLAYDLGNRRKVPTHVHQSTARRLGKAVTDTMTGLFHHSERMIREVTYMTSFRLNRAKFPNKSFEEIAHLAEKETYAALSNFSSVNRPRGLVATAERGVILDAHKPLGRAVLQFKMFPAFVTTYFVRNFYRMVGQGMTKQERKEAATQFFGSLMMSYALAGYMGVPGMSFAMGVAQGLRNLFRDEDDEDPIEKRDLEFWFRNIWMQQTFGNVKIGDHNMADLMDRGLIAGLTGYDISSSLSLNNMWFPDMKEQSTAQATMLDYALSLSGPFASLTVQQIPKAVDYFNQGKILQGVEQLLPGMMRSPVTAYRYSKEGATTSIGATIKDADEFTMGQIVAQGLGFTTEGLVAQREAIFKANALMLQVKNDKKQLLTRLDVGLRSDRDVENILDDVARFNYKNPFDPITNNTLQESVKNHLKQRMMSDRGVPIDKKYYPMMMDLIEPSTRRLDVEAKK